MSALEGVRSRRWWRAHPTAALLAVVVAALVAAAIIGLRSPTSPDHGMHTTCRDYVKMTHAERVAVMRTAGTPRRYVEPSVAYYLSGCRADVKSSPDEPIGGIGG